MIDVQILRGSQVRDLRGNIGRITSVSIPWVKLAWIKPDGVTTTEETLPRSASRVWNEIDILTLDRGWIPMGSILGARPRGRVDDFVSEVRKSVQTADEAKPKLPAKAAAAQESGAPVARRVEILYRKTRDESFKRANFENCTEASEFVDKLLEDGHEEVRWWADGMEEDWEVDLRSMFREIGRSCNSCDADFLEWFHCYRGKEIVEGGNPFVHLTAAPKDSIGPGPRKGKLQRKDDWDCSGSNYNYVCTNKRTGYEKKIKIKPGWKASYNREYRAWRRKHPAYFYQWRKEMQRQRSKKGKG